MASYFERDFKRKDKEGNVLSTYKKWCGEEKINGKLKTVYGETKKECKAKLEALLVDAANYGVELDKTSINVSTWLYRYLFTSVHQKVANSTFDRYMNLYNKHVKDSSFGNMKITSVKQINVQEYFNKTKISASGQGMLRYLLRQSFDVAINNNFIRTNPVVNIKIESKSKTTREVDVFTLDEQEKFISVLHATRYRLFFLTALFTGMRLGELVALKWANVDLDNNIITVLESYKRTVAYKQDGTFEHIIDKKEPKTKNGLRSIPIPQFLSDELKTLDQTTEHVFTSSTGRHMTPDNTRRIQKSLCKKANIPYHNFHALRHTYATRLIENGVDIKTVSELLGHADVNITLKIYVHSTDDTKKDAVNKLENIFTVKSL